tara:strand:+ start:467 stop:826 length:360 start_codon:yes stop_codon:yes gene_type:complete
MKIDLLIENIEMNFETLTGFSFHGLVGIVVGLIIFSLFLFLIRYEKRTKETFDFKDSNLDEVGDPIEANINLARSLIEMKEIDKADECIKKVEFNDELSLKQREKVKILRDKITKNKNG